MTDLLAPVTRVDPAQLLREQWERAVQGEDLMKIVGFVRDSPTLRNDGPSCQAMNGVFKVIQEIQRTGQDLTTGTIKTRQDCRDALLSMIAAKNIAAASWSRYASVSVDKELLDAKVADLFARHNITYQKAKEDGGENESGATAGGKVRVCAHYIRGHVESVCYRLAEDPNVTTAFPSNAMIANAGHQVPTFHKSYSRPMVQRQVQAFKDHKNSSDLSKEEAQLMHWGVLLVWCKLGCGECMLFYFWSGGWYYILI